MTGSIKVLGCVSIALLLMSGNALGDAAADLQALKDAKALLDAQAARDASEAAAIKAANDLAKAKADAANTQNQIRAAQYDSQAATATAEVGAQTATLAALKTTFGAVPTIGTDGTISITDASGGVLLETKAASLAATWQMAGELCDRLRSAKITDAYMAPPDLDAKIQNARMVLREFNDLSEKVRDTSNRSLVGLEGVQSQIAPAAVLGAVSLLEYGAGALQSISKLFRSDYAIALSTDASRVAWLEYFVAAKCPAQVPRAQLEAVARGQSIDEVSKRLNEMLEFYSAASNQKTALQNKIDELKKKDSKTVEDALKSANQAMTDLGKLDVWLPRVQALMTSVAANPGTFLDALTWSAFGDDKNRLQVSSHPRINVVLSTQDGQVSSTSWLTGKKTYGRSSAELIYRVAKPDGIVLAAGYVTAHSSMGEIDFSAQRATQVDDEQFAVSQ